MRTGTAIAIAGAVLLIAAGPAVAGVPTESLGRSHGLDYRKAKLAGVFAQTGPDAHCDGDDQVTGGGGTISKPTRATRLHASYPFTTSGTGWSAEGSATSGTARTVSAYAICGTEVVTYEDSSSGLGMNTVLHALAVCPAGAPDPLGGGGMATGDDIDLVASFPIVPPSTPGWSPVAYNDSSSDTVWNSYAVCTGTRDLRYRESKLTKLAPDEIGSAVAKCKRREAVIGGGFVGTDGNAVGYRTTALATRPWDSKADGGKTPDDGWLAKALNLESPLSMLKVKLQAIAVCLRP